MPALLELGQGVPDTDVRLTRQLSRSSNVGDRLGGKVGDQLANAGIGARVAETLDPVRLLGLDLGRDVLSLLSGTLGGAGECLDPGAHIAVAVGVEPADIALRLSAKHEADTAGCSAGFRRGGGRWCRSANGRHDRCRQRRGECFRTQREQSRPEQQAPGRCARGRRRGPRGEPARIRAAGAHPARRSGCSRSPPIQFCSSRTTPAMFLSAVKRSSVLWMAWMSATRNGLPPAPSSIASSSPRRCRGPRRRGCPRWAYRGWRRQLEPAASARSEVLRSERRRHSPSGEGWLPGRPMRRGVRPWSSAAPGRLRQSSRLPGLIAERECPFAPISAGMKGS